MTDNERFYEEQIHKATNRAECLRLQREELLYNNMINFLNQKNFNYNFPEFEEIWEEFYGFSKEFYRFSIDEIQKCYNYIKE